MKAKRNTFYRTSTGNIVYISNDFNVGWGFDEEMAADSVSHHNHWLKEGNTLNPRLVEIKTKPIQMENK
jgi:hypothetical protein